MPILHIQHRITDFDTWASAFNRFAEARRSAGVRAHRVLRPVDDPAYVVIELDFDTADAAESFGLPEVKCVGRAGQRPRPRRDPRGDGPGAGRALTAGPGRAR